MAGKKTVGEKETQPKRCFVIGPIGADNSEEREHADMLLQVVIEPVLSNDPFGYQVIRSDSISDPGMINDKMIHEVINADLAIADLTYLNPNAFYELGIRHAVKKPVIHMARSGTKLPFDNMAQRTIFLSTTNINSMNAAKETLAGYVTTVEDEDYVLTNPITQSNASYEIMTSGDPMMQVTADILDRIGRLERASQKNQQYAALRRRKKLSDEISALDYIDKPNLSSKNETVGFMSGWTEEQKSKFLDEYVDQVRADYLDIESVPARLERLRKKLKE